MSEAAAVLALSTETPPAPETAPETASNSEQKATEVAPNGATHSKSFAAARRREQALQRQREEVATARADLARTRHELEVRAAEINRLAAKPNGPLEALDRFGYSYKDATEYALNQSQPTAEQIARDTRAELERDREDRRRADETAKKAQVQASAAEVAAVEADFKTEVTAFVKENSQKYELTALQGAEQLVYDVIELHFHKTAKAGKPAVLSIGEAADLVEKHLEKQAERLLSTGKIKAKLSSQPATPQKPGTPGQATAQPNRTLNNGMTPSTPTLVTSAAIEDDRMKRAMAALGG